MPTYEYECDKCAHKFEAFHSMTAKSIKKCPECGGKVTRLLGSGSGIIFKGTGFYQTDYKNSKKPKEEKSCPKSDSSHGGCKGCPNSTS